MKIGLRLAAIALGSTMGSSAVVAGQGPSDIIVPTPNSPVEIISYSAWHSGLGDLTNIGYKVEFTNRAKQPIAAVQFGFLSFDVFNRFLGKFGGIVMGGAPSW